MTSPRLMLVGLFGVALLGSGCVATYAPKPDEKMVAVQSVGNGQPQICKDGQMYWPPPMKDHPGTVYVPAGERLTVGVHQVSDGYQVIHFCRPFLSFVPREGSTYVLNSGLSGDGRCFVELARDEPGAPNGLAPEWSVGRASCVVRK